MVGLSNGIFPAYARQLDNDSHSPPSRGMLPAWVRGHAGGMVIILPSRIQIDVVFYFFGFHEVKITEPNQSLEPTPLLGVGVSLILHLP